MLRNSLYFLHRQSYSSRLQNTFTRTLHLKNRLYLQNHNFCTSATENNTGPVPLSYSVFQPESSLSSNIPVIILHGLLGSKQNWRGLGKAMAVKTKRKVYALDARNHGDSPRVNHMDYPVMAEDLKYFINSHSMPEAIIVGHSMGGRTAMYFSLTNESLVNKLVVVDISPRKMPSQSKIILNYMTAMQECLSSVSNVSLQQARKIVDGLLAKSIPEISMRQFLVSNLRELDKTLDWKANIEVLREKFSSDIMQFPSVSGHFSKDTLFICGGESTHVLEDDHPYIKSLFPKADIVYIPGAGHWVHSEKSSDFLEIICNFL